MPRRAWPDQMKARLGVRRSRRRPEPTPTAGVPEIPSHLRRSRVARDEWKRLVALATELGTLARTDQAMLEAVVGAYVEYRAARKVIDAKGASYKCKSSSGAVMERARPECGLAGSAWRRYVAGLQTFGLSPQARVKTPRAAPPPSKEFLRFIADEPKRPDPRISLFRKLRDPRAALRQAEEDAG